MRLTDYSKSPLSNLTNLEKSALKTNTLYQPTLLASKKLSKKDSALATKSPYQDSSKNSTDSAQTL